MEYTLVQDFAQAAPCQAVHRNLATGPNNKVIDKIIYITLWNPKVFELLTI